MSWTQEELERALEGHGPTLRQLIDALTPVIQVRVARVLLRRSSGAGNRDVRQEVEDFCQEVFVSLFADSGRVLRSWEPARGLSLLNFVGFVAERQAASILRTGKRSPWTEDPTEAQELDQEAPLADPEAATATRDLLRRVLRRMEERLSPLGRSLFQLLYLKEESVAEVQRQTGLGTDAVYAWRSRLRKMARGVFREVMSENRPVPQNTSGSET